MLMASVLVDPCVQSGGDDFEHNQIRSVIERMAHIEHESQGKCSIYEIDPIEGVKERNVARSLTI